MTLSLKKSQSRGLSPFALVLICFTGLISGCSQPPGNITGSVIYNNRPDAGAVIYIVNTADTSDINTTRADAAGNFTFEKIPSGQYLLTAHSLNKPETPRNILKGILDHAAYLEKIGLTIPGNTAEFKTLMDSLAKLETQYPDSKDNEFLVKLDRLLAELRIYQFKADTLAGPIIREIRGHNARYFGQIGLANGLHIQTVSVSPDQTAKVVIGF